MSLIESLATETLSVDRYSDGSWVDGRYQKGTPVTTTFTASVQPLRPNETQIIPEHKRNSEAVKIYTQERLFNADEKNGIPADVVTHDGKIYEIMDVSNWSIGTDLPHYKAIAVLRDGEGSGGR